MLVTFLSDGPVSLEKAQKIVGGYVARVRLTTGDIMLVDEDGLPKNLEVNKVASMLAGQIIVGPALILQGPAKKGWR